MNTAIVAIGSNIDPDVHIPRALRLLGKEQRLRDTSDFMQTAPEGFKDQPDFQNGAACVETAMDLESFRAYLKELEITLGRKKGPIKAGPRIIDLDLIYWNGSILHSDYEKYYTRQPVDQLIERLSLTVQDRKNISPEA
ncbi:MAG: 2-amino-4-hydroxy-6-hydroxymethyldihydropteridine diphosphokinase [Leptospiraceae bacterium]|nr:2-amino-4-hydroxy-6-hydroxymethyldihydropteridine diphosphokinase [Leptospiraceae bacterium]MCB1303681.1 2-amino-4-hydroxy-6-hydroxymethyldihydropteridine diphosphokinase [Leptospiraceae bacterium]